MLRTRQFLTLLTSKCASRHNRVHFFDITTSKGAPTLCVLCILTWKRASRHNGAHFFDISTSKNGPCMVCFVDMFFTDVRRWGRWFHERGCILEHPIFRFAKVILRDRCSTSFNLALSFRGKHGTLDRWSAKISKRIGMRPSALHWTFNFWRKSPRVASFLMLSTSKIEEVSQNCFDFGVVKFENWRSRAELLRFWCCQVQKLRKSRRIVSFSNL